MKKAKTYYSAVIDVRDYSPHNRTKINPENSDTITTLNLGLFDKPSKAEKIRALLSDNNPHLTFLLQLTEFIDPVQDGETETV